MRRREWAVVLGVGVAILYAGFRFAIRYWDFGAAAGELPAAVRDYRAAGLPWTAADIATSVPPGENAAPLLRQTIAALPDAKACDAFADAYRTGAPAAVPSGFSSAIRLAHLAAGRPGLDFGRDWDLGPNLLMPELAQVKLFCRLLAARAQSRAVARDDDGALADLEDARRLAVLIGSEPSVISALVGLACDRTATDGARRCLVAAAGSATRLERYRRRLAAPPSLPDLHRAFRGAIYNTVAIARNLDRMGMGRGLFPMSDYEPFSDGGEDPHDVDKPPPAMRHDGLPANTRSKAYMARCLQNWVALARATRGLTEDMEVIGRRSGEIEERYIASKGLSHQFGPILFPFLGQFGRSNRIAEASRALNLAFAQALLQHARTGRWPVRTGRVDPLGRGPLGMRFEGGRFRVWSVGRNGVDDGGLTAREAYAAGKRSDDEVAAYPPIPEKVPRSAPPPPSLYPPD